MSELLKAFLEVSVYSLALGFGCAYGMQLLDYLMDYKQKLWKIRYKLAFKSALRIGWEAKLDSALLDAEESEDGVNTMASIYGQLAKQDQSFKLWNCVYCMSIRLNLILGISLSGLLVYLGFGFMVAPFFLLSFCFNWYFLTNE